MASAVAVRNPRRHPGLGVVYLFFLTSTCQAPIKLAPVELRLRVPIDRRASFGRRRARGRSIGQTVSLPVDAAGGEYDRVAGGRGSAHVDHV